MPPLQAKSALDTEEAGADSKEWGRPEVEGYPWLRRVPLVAGGVFAVAMFVAVIWALVHTAEEVAPGDLKGTRTKIAAKELDAEKRSVMKVVSSFIEAKTLEGKLEWVLQTEGIERRMGDHYQRSPARAQQIYDFPVIALTQRPEGNFYRVQALTVANERLNFVLPVTDEKPLIAWEAHVGYCEVGWDEFLTGRPGEPVEMRVYVEAATHYEPPYKDRGEYLSVRLSRPDSARDVFAYLAKSSTAGIAAMRSLIMTGRPEPVVVQAHFPDSKQSVVLIDAFLGGGWHHLPSEE